ncbi:MAG TPA: hypothetical protein VN306_10385, partial [Mycobacterium sp.]|nr:hypothetical protein [Mycobacterium sp.]
MSPRVRVICHADTGGPFTRSEIDERLTELGVVEHAGDREAAQEVSPPDKWVWAQASCAYMTKTIESWATDSPKPGGGRNPWACSQFVRLSCAHRLGCITEADYDRAKDILAERLRWLVENTEPRRRLRRYEIRDLQRCGIKRASEKTDDECCDELGRHDHDDTEAFSMGAGDDDPGFWSQTDVLAHVHAFARSRGASPHATLGTVLRRAIGCIEPHVVLPPIIGGQVSLNLFTAPVGPSGAGKDTANEAGHDAVDFYISLGSALVAVDDATLIHPGTGEGLARVFAGRGSQPGETRAHLQVPDIATL